MAGQTSISAPQSARQPLSERILDAVPGYRDAESRAEIIRPHAMAARQHVTEATHEVDTSFRAIIERVLAAGENLDDVFKQYEIAHSSQMHRKAFNRLILEVAESVEQRPREILDSHRNSADTVLEFLHAEMDSLFAEINQHRDVLAAHPESAEAALFVEDGAARWKLVGEFIDRYDELRTEHRKVMRRQDPDFNPRPFYFVAQTPHFLAVEPYWIVKRRLSSPPNQRRTEMIEVWAQAWGRVFPDDRLGPLTAAERNPNADVRQFYSIAAGRSISEDANRRELFPVGQTKSEWLLTLADVGPWMPDAHTIGDAYRLADQMIRATSNSVFLDSARRLEEIGVHTGIELPPPSQRPRSQGRVQMISADAGGL